MFASSNLEYAVILAGGLGTRLGGLTTALPKVLVPVNGKPFLEHKLELLRRNGVEKVMLLTGHLGAQIEAAFGSGSRLGMQIEYSAEPHPLGTAGALKYAESKLPDTFFLTYGDAFLDCDYQAAAKQFFRSVKSTPAGLMTVIQVGMQDEKLETGNVKLDPSHKMVLSYKKGSGNDYDYLDAGVLVFSSDIVSLIPDGRAELEEVVYPVLSEQRGKLFCFQCSAHSHEIGTPKRLAEFQRYLDSRTDKFLD